jgi:hypothetical protein
MKSIGDEAPGDIAEITYSVQDERVKDHGKYLRYRIDSVVSALCGTRGPGNHGKALDGWSWQENARVAARSARGLEDGGVSKDVLASGVALYYGERWRKVPCHRDRRRCPHDGLCLASLPNVLVGRIIRRIGALQHWSTPEKEGIFDDAFPRP